MTVPVISQHIVCLVGKPFNYQHGLLHCLANETNTVWSSFCGSNRRRKTSWLYTTGRHSMMTSGQWFDVAESILSVAQPRSKESLARSTPANTSTRYLFLSSGVSLVFLRAHETNCSCYWRCVTRTPFQAKELSPPLFCCCCRRALSSVDFSVVECPLA